MLWVSVLVLANTRMLCCTCLCFVLHSLEMTHALLTCC